MNETQPNRNMDRKYRLILFLVIGLTAFSSAIREWREVVTVTEQVGAFISAFTSVVVPSANASTRVMVKSCSIQDQTAEDFRWSGTVAPGQAVEIKGINGDIAAEPASTNQIEVVAHKKARRGDISSVQIKVVEHAGGVTICALYPAEDGSIPSTCEPGDAPKRSSTNVDNRKNDVSVDFVVRVPQAVGFVGRTINGDVSATSLTGNVISRTINGSIKISTTGYADATTINGAISAKLGNANWNGKLHFTTVNGEITIDMPGGVNTQVEAETLNGTIVTDFPLNIETTKSWKHVRGTIGAGGRELVLKTLNGSINLRTS